MQSRKCLHHHCICCEKVSSAHAVRGGAPLMSIWTLTIFIGPRQIEFAAGSKSKRSDGTFTESRSQICAGVMDDMKPTHQSPLPATSNNVHLSTYLTQLIGKSSTGRSNDGCDHRLMIGGQSAIIARPHTADGREIDAGLQAFSFKTLPAKYHLTFGTCDMQHVPSPCLMISDEIDLTSRHPFVLEGRCRKLQFMSAAVTGERYDLLTFSRWLPNLA
nr:hypothetical protein CFP56_37316 [Quercus suber]